MIQNTKSVQSMCPFAESALDSPAIQGTAPPSGGAEFVALSKFGVVNGMMEEVKQAFRHRSHLVDDALGFVKMEVMVPFITRTNSGW